MGLLLLDCVTEVFWFLKHVLMYIKSPNAEKERPLAHRTSEKMI